MKSLQAPLTSAPTSCIRWFRDLSLTDLPPDGPVFMAADAVTERLPSVQPKPWEPDAAAMKALSAALPDERFETLWLSDGLDRDGRAELAAALEAKDKIFKTT